VALHAGLVLVLLVAETVAPDYVRLQLTRVMVLAVYAMGYNLLFGYTGLLSLGHAMFFGAGLYGAALGVVHLALPVPAAFALGILAGAALSLVVGLLALRTTGVAFMIVTLMFAQAAHLAVLYFGTWTRGDEGLVLPPEARGFEVAGLVVDLSDIATRYHLALGLFALALALLHAVVRSPLGEV
ncbi:MAG: branched-chain amino acid ABC transporter permease, partial [Rhodobacteraceae bacterium]|nr:branched-chain amino acid ABC transporter permease [Paracoccaceae bacterium]